MIAGRSAPARSFAASSTPSATSPAWKPGSAPGSDSAALKTVSSGKSRKVGPDGWAIERSIAAAVARGDVGRVLDGVRRLHERLDERDVVDLLKRPGAPAHLGRAAPENGDRRAVVEGAGDRAHAVRHARARGQRRDARLAGRLRVPLGGPHGRRSWRTSTISIPSSLQPS